MKFDDLPRSEDPPAVMSLIMAIRLARVEHPAPERVREEAVIAGEIYFQAIEEGTVRWNELTRRRRQELAKEHARKPSETSTPSSDDGDTPPSGSPDGSP